MHAMHLIRSLGVIYTSWFHDSCGYDDDDDDDNDDGLRPF